MALSPSALSTTPPKVLRYHENGLCCEVVHVREPLFGSNACPAVEETLPRTVPLADLMARPAYRQKYQSISQGPARDTSVGEKEPNVHLT